jgi:hypothetical protein
MHENGNNTIYIVDTKHICRVSKTTGFAVMLTYLKSDVRLLAVKAAVILAYATRAEDVSKFMNEVDMISPILIKELLQPVLDKPNKKYVVLSGCHTLTPS